MKKETQQLVWALGLSAIALYLTLTKSGKGAAASIGTEVTNMLTPRGIRNNNPGNIRLSSTTWQGQVPSSEQTDPDFVQFSSPAYGIRAIAKILDSYASRGLNTVQSIINTWAPPTENDTAAYVDAVASSMGVDPNTTLSQGDQPALIAAIIDHENGSQPYTTAEIDTGVSMA